MSAYTKQDLKIMQSWSLERKIQVTQTRIIEWYQRYNGQVYISFSGGKDSTVLLDLARRIYPDIEAVFVDTGLEYPEIREFVKSKENVTTLRPKMRFDEVIKKYGYPVISKEISRVIDYNKRWIETNNQNVFNKVDYKKIRGTLLNNQGMKSDRYNCEQWKFLLDAPFNISHYCCEVMKKQPLRQIKKKPIIGTMADESRQRESGWIKSGRNAFEQIKKDKKGRIKKTKPISKPLSFWTEQDILKYIKTTGLPYAKIYGDIVNVDKDGNYYDVPLTDGCKLCTTGVSRTGCMFCMFGVHLESEPNRFQQMKLTHPKQYDYCMNKLGLKEVLDFINVPYE